MRHPFYLYIPDPIDKDVQRIVQSAAITAGAITEFIKVNSLKWM